MKNNKRHIRSNLYLKKTTKKAGLLFLGLIIGLVIFFQIFKSYKNSIWERDRQLNLAIEYGKGKLAYLTINKKMEEVKIYVFEDNTMIGTALGFGKYQAKSLKPLADQENIDFGNFLIKSMTQYLGVMTDGYIIGLKTINADIKGIIKYMLFDKNSTNLSSWDKVKVWYFINSLRSEKIEKINLSETKALVESELEDRTKVFVESEEFDNYILLEIADTNNLESELTWEIFNGTNNDGLAYLVSKITANTGFNVVGVRQAKDSYEQSFISVKNKDQISNDVKYYATYFDFKIKYVPVLNDRADVAVVVGEDFYQKNCSYKN